MAVDNLLGPGSTIGQLSQAGQTPTLTQVPLDPTSQAILDQQSATAEQGPTAVAAADNAGLNQAADSMKMGDTAAFNQSAGMGNNPAMVQGLRNAYNSQANKNIELIKSQNDYKAQMQSAQYLQQAAQEALGQQAAQNKMFDTMTQAYTNNMAARAGAISALFGVGGTALGQGMASSGQPSNAPIKTGTPQTSTGDLPDVTGLA